MDKTAETQGREAVAWEHEVMLKSESKLDMTFASFFEIYEEEREKARQEYLEKVGMHRSFRW